MEEELREDASDEQLGRWLRAKSQSLGCTPFALLRLAEATAAFNRWSVIPSFPPQPILQHEEELRLEHLAMWPEWSRQLVEPGCVVESLLWPNGTRTVRLVSRRKLVLASCVFQPNSANQHDGPT